MPWVNNSNLALQGNNYTYDVFQQNLATNCTAACLVMMARYALNRNVPLGLAQLWIRQVQHNDDALLGTPHGQPLQRLTAPPAAWHWGGNNGIGGSAGDLYYALALNYSEHRWYWVMSGPGSTQVIEEQLAHCTPQRPAIVSLAWHGGGGHVALCLGRRRLLHADLVFLDPEYGVVISTPVGFAGFLPYDTQHNSFGQAGAQGLIGQAVFS